MFEHGFGEMAVCLSVILFRKHKYISPEAMSENISLMSELMEEAAVNSKTQNIFAPMKRKLNLFKRALSKMKGGTTLEKNIWDFILSLDGNGNLHGFGFQGARGNAEKTSLIELKQKTTYVPTSIIKKENIKMNMEKAKILEAAKALNELNLAAFNVKTVGISNEDLVRQFMAAVESVPEDKEEAISEAIGDVFNALRDEEDNKTLGFDRTYVPPQSKAGKEKAAPAPAKEKAPTKEKKDKEKAADGEKKKNNLPARVKNSIGHVVGSMSAAIDAALEKGATNEELVAMLVKDFGRDEKMAANKVKGDLANLLKLYNVTVVFDPKTKKYKIAAKGKE